jgi:hypothetical protein
MWSLPLLIVIVDRLREQSHRWKMAPAPAAEAGCRSRPRRMLPVVHIAPGDFDFLRALGLCLSGLRKCLDARADPGDRQLDLLVFDHACDFLVGLAFGGFIYARFMGEREARLSTFGLIQLWVGLSALATIPLFENLPLIFSGCCTASAIDSPCFSICRYFYRRW